MIPGVDLAPSTWRSQIGMLATRVDFGALAAVFTIGAIVNAAGMTAPVVEYVTSSAIAQAAFVVLGLCAGLALLALGASLPIGAKFSERATRLALALPLAAAPLAAAPATRVPLLRRRPPYQPRVVAPAAPAAAVAPTRSERWRFARPARCDAPTARPARALPPRALARRRAHRRRPRRGRGRSVGRGSCRCAGALSAGRSAAGPSTRPDSS